MATLANQTISSTYDGLIKTSTDQPVPISGVQLLEDGVGNSLALSVGRANQGVTVTGTLSATSITGVLADGVTATTQTLGDNSTKVATTAYVDAQVTASDLDFAGDTGTGAVDLDSQTFTIAGTANEIETVASGQTVTIGLPNNVTIAGNLTVDTNTLYVDSTNNRVGVGTSSPTHLMQLYAASLPELRLGDATTQIQMFTNTDAFFGTVGSHNLIIRTAATERMRIDSSGNVGIGTSSPLSGLNPSTYRGIHISGTFPMMRGSDGATNYWDLIGDSSATYLSAVGVRNLILQTNGAERMRIDSSGNVGIGRTPSDKLDVAGVIRATNTTDPSYYGTLSNPDGLTRLSAFGGGSSLAFNIGGTERMRIDSSGNVIVGSTTANNANAATLRQDGTAHVNNVQLANAAGSVGGTTPSIYSPAGGQLAISLNSAERLRIDGSGNVGIGTTTPSTSLGGAVGLVISSTFDSQLRLQNSVSGGTSTDGILLSIASNGDGYFWNYDNVSLVFGANNSEKARILPTGGITFNGDTAAANALDDYEEGTWTPFFDASVSNGTISYTWAIGTYTKVGNLVNCFFTLVVNTVSVAASGHLRIAGLPFTISNSTVYRSAGAVANASGIDANGTQLTIEALQNTNFAPLYGFNSNSSFGTANAASLGSGSFINGVITYTV